MINEINEYKMMLTQFDEGAKKVILPTAQQHSIQPTSNIQAATVTGESALVSSKTRAVPSTTSSTP